MRIAFLLMFLSRVLIAWNNWQVDWFEQKIKDVQAGADFSLIVFTDEETNKAGAMNYQGKIIIPPKSDTLDPWTGSIIYGGMYHEGDLYWKITEGKVGIVDKENEEIIPQEYGYLSHTCENQFIAGTGMISKALDNSGMYIDKRYGVITEAKTVIPFEYDELSYEETAKEYIAQRSKEDGTIIKRRFSTSGRMISETVQEPETETETETQTEAETEIKQETEVIKETETRSYTQEEEADIKTYEDNGTQTDKTTMEDNIWGKERRIHFQSGICTLRLLETEDILMEFPGSRTFGVNLPRFSEDETLILDDWENQLFIYSAKSGVLLAQTESETSYLYRDGLLAYDNGTHYLVKNLENQILFETDKGAQDQFMNSGDEKSRFVFNQEYFVYVGDTGRTLVSNAGVIISEDIDLIIYNDENSTKTKLEEKIFLCVKDDKYGAFNMAGDKIMDYRYRSLEFFQGHVQGIKVIEGSGEVGIVNYKGEIIIPFIYDNVGYGITIEGASESLIEEYVILNPKGTDYYFGQVGKDIYYLDEMGIRQERVHYLSKQEENNGGLSDLLTLGTQMENQITYRTTGYKPVMCNAFGTGIGYKRCDIRESIGGNRLTFLLIDDKDSKAGIYQYRYGTFTLMGYQQMFFNIWLVVSRLFVLLSAIALLRYMSSLHIVHRITARLWKQRIKRKRGKRRHGKV